jgi:type III secretion protein J
MRRWAAVCAWLGMAGCASETIVHDIEEREANTIIELLSDNHINATKGTRDTGRVVLYSIAVPATKRVQAIKVLNKYDLPRRQDKGYTEVFGEAGLIPSATEEHAKALAALEGEIERQLKLVEGVLDAQVQIVMPDDNALRTTEAMVPATTASVILNYLAVDEDRRPISEQEVKDLVAAGVEKLTPENVVVVMRPTGVVARAIKKAEDCTPVNQGICSLTRQSRTILYAIVIGFILLLALAFVATQARLRVVRGRLVRLQEEIARARHRSDTSTSGP